MKKIISKLMGGVLLLSLSMSLTSCEGALDDILGEWSRPTPDGGSSSDEPTPTMEATPLTLEAITAGTIVVKNPQTGMQFSLNGAAKQAVTTDAIPVAVGDKVAFYGNGTNIKKYSGTIIKGGTADVKVYGNIMSLVDETGFATNTKLTANDTFVGLFFGNAKLTDASGLLLPATDLAEHCYGGMFQGCTSLTTAPAELPATELQSYCYVSMFSSCTSLTTAPKLPAENLANDCYYAMFGGCKALTETPKLPATTLKNNCYKLMFDNCSSLTTAYVKAGYTNTYDECTNMFNGCLAAGTKTLHTTSTNKGSWDTVMPSPWAGWTAVDDWND